MRPLIISHLYPTKENRVRGSFVHDQVTAIKERGVDLRVISPTPLCPPPLGLSPKWREYQAVPEESVIEGIQVYYPRYFSLPKNRFLGLSGRSLYKSLLRPRFQEFVAEATVIHAHAVFPDGMAAAMLKQEFPGKKLILTIHGADLQKKARISNKVGDMLRNCLAQADLVLVSSGKLEELALKYGGIEKEKIKVIPNGLPQAIIRRGQEGLPYSRRENKVVTVCNLVPEKAVDVAIKAFAGLRSSWSYEIIGSGPLRGNLEKLALAVGNGNIVFSGRRDRGYIADALARAKVYLMPSREEAFGVAYLEALSCGTPIIGTRGQGAGYIIEDGRQGLLVKVEDIEATAKALEELMVDGEKAGKMGLRGRELVAERFDLRRIADEIIECY